MDLIFYIDIEDASGNKLGAGPLSSATGWRYTARLDRAGDFSFSVPAADPKTAELQNGRKVRAWSQLGGQWTEIGAGVIDDITTEPQPDGRVILRVAGLSEERELSYRSVGFLELASGGSSVSHASAVSAIGAFAPAGWAFTPDGSPPVNSVYARYAGESVLQAYIKMAQQVGTHFYRSGPRTLTFASTFTDSGVRAIQARGDLVPETAAITALSARRETYERMTRIYPFGFGQGRARLTLAATNRSAPAGYTLNAAAGWIQNNTADAAWGRMERWVEYKDLGPVSNTDADTQAAANALFDVALDELRRRSENSEQLVYTLTLAECSTLLRPMQTVRVVYRDIDQQVDIDETLNVLEATWEIDGSEVRTTGLVVSNVDRWPESDADAVVSSMEQGTVFQAHPQANANSDTISYNKTVDAIETATFRWRFRNNVTQLNRVLFEFQLLPLESNVRAVGTETGGSGELITDPAAGNTGNPSNNTSGAPSNNTSGGPSVSDTGAASGNTGAASGNTGAPSSNTSGTPSTNTSGTPSNNTSGGPSVSDTGAAIGSTGAASGNTGAAGGNTGTPSNNTSGTPSVSDTGAATGNTGAATGDTGGSGTLTTGAPTGGDIVAAGQHGHGVILFEGTGNLGTVTLHDLGGGNYELRNSSVSVAAQAPTAISGNHTHNIGSHTHDLASHTHDLGSHTHDLGGHTHSLNNHQHDLGNHTHSLNNHSHDLNSHTHDLGGHTHSLNNHTHDLGSHTHSLGNHTHDLGSHTHSLGNHTHTLGGHTHSLNDHTHSLNDHTHDLGNHTHSLEAAIQAVYGIYRESQDNTLDLTELEYSVNGGSWLGLDTSTDVGDGWRQLDITAAVQQAGNFRPQQASNRVEIRGRNLLRTIDYAVGTGAVAVVLNEGTAGLVDGMRVEISGNGNPPVANAGGIPDGEYAITVFDSTTIIIVVQPNDYVVNNETGGTVRVLKTAQIDAQLCIDNVVQAIVYS